MADPSKTPRGSIAGYTSTDDVKIAVPVDLDEKQSLRTPFEAYAESTLLALQATLRRLRSQKLFTDRDAIHYSSGWVHTDDTVQKVRLIGEVWAYGAFMFSRTSDPLEVESDGDISATVVGTLADESQYPISAARLFSANAGRLAAGHVDSSGRIYLDALSTSQDVAPGSRLTLVGRWPLLHLFDSEA